MTTAFERGASERTSQSIRTQNKPLHLTSASLPAVARSAAGERQRYAAEAILRRSLAAFDAMMPPGRHLIAPRPHEHYEQSRCVR